MIHIHSSPTPSRRSTDYADIGPGTHYGQKQMVGHPTTLGMTNGHVGQHHLTSLHAMNPRDQQHMSHDNHMGMHGQFRPSGQDHLHGNAVNHQLNPNEQGYPPGDQQIRHGQFQQNHLRGYSPQSQTSDPHRQFYPDEQGFTPQGMAYPHQDNVRMRQFSSRYVDTLTRVHSPPNPGNNNCLQNQDDIDYPPSSQTPSQSTEESWNPMENLNYRGHMTNYPVSRSSSFKSTESTQSFERAPLPNSSNDLRIRGHANALSPLPENQFLEAATQLKQHPNAMGMQDQSRIQSRSMGQRMNRIVVNQELRGRAHSFEGFIDTDIELGQSNLDIQQRAFPSLPTAGMEPGHANSINPIPNPHCIEYSMNPEVQLSHSQSIPAMQARRATQYPVQDIHHPPDNQMRSHAYPSQPTHISQTQRQQQQPISVHSTSQQLARQPQKMVLPPKGELPPPVFKGDPPPYPGPTTGGHSNQQYPLPNQHPGKAMSTIQLQQGGCYKPDFSSYPDHQQSLPDNHHITPQPWHQRESNHLEQNVTSQQSGVPRVNHSMPNLAFSNGGSTGTPGFRRIPMNRNGGHILSVQRDDDQASEDMASAWEQVDHIQQQLESEMQNMLTPLVTDEVQFQFQPESFSSPNLNDSINSTSSFEDQTHHKMVLPLTDMKSSNGFTMTSSNPPPPTVHTKPSAPPKVKPKPSLSSAQKVNGYDENSLALNKTRPNVPDLEHLIKNDPKKPQLKRGEVKRAVWMQMSINRAVESSSDTESDSDSSVDTVIAGPGDTESLKSAHV